MEVGKFIKMDERGYITIPKEYRDALKIRPGSLVHITCYEDRLRISPVTLPVKRLLEI